MKIYANKWAIYFLTICSLPQEHHFAKDISNECNEYLKVSQEIISKSQSYNKLMDTFRENWESPFTYLIKRGYIPADVAKPDKLSVDAIKKMQKQYAGSSENMIANDDFSIDSLIQGYPKDFRRDADNCNTKAKSKGKSNEECEEYYDDVTECYYYDDSTGRKTPVKPTKAKTTCNPNSVETTTATVKMTNCPTAKTTTCAPLVDPFDHERVEGGKKPELHLGQKQTLSLQSQKDQLKAQKGKENTAGDSAVDTTRLEALNLAQKIAENTVAKFSKSRIQLQDNKLSNIKSPSSTHIKIKRAGDWKDPTDLGQKPKYFKAEMPYFYAKLTPLNAFKPAQKSFQNNWQSQETPKFENWRSNYPYLKQDNNNNFDTSFHLKDKTPVQTSYTNNLLSKKPIAPKRYEIFKAPGLQGKTSLKASHPGHKYTTPSSRIEDEDLFELLRPENNPKAPSNKEKEKEWFELLHSEKKSKTPSSNEEDKEFFELLHPGSKTPTSNDEDEDLLDLLHAGKNPKTPSGDEEDRDMLKFLRPGHNPIKTSHKDKDLFEFLHPGHKPTKPSHKEDKDLLEFLHPGHKSTKPSHKADRELFELLHPGHKPTKPSHKADKKIFEALHPGHKVTTPSSREEDDDVLQTWFAGHQKPLRPKKPLFEHEKPHSQADNEEKPYAKNDHTGTGKDGNNNKKKHKKIFTFTESKRKKMKGKSKNHMLKSNDYFDNNNDDYFYDKPDSYISLNAIYIVNKKGDKNGPESANENAEKSSVSNATNHENQAKQVVLRGAGKGMKRKIEPEIEYFEPSYKTSNGLCLDKHSVSGSELSRQDKSQKTDVNYFSMSKNLDSGKGLANLASYGSIANHAKKRRESSFLNPKNIDNQYSKGDFENNVAHNPNFKKRGSDYLNTLNTESQKSQQSSIENKPLTTDFENTADFKNDKKETENPLDSKINLNEQSAENKQSLKTNFEKSGNYVKENMGLKNQLKEKSTKDEMNLENAGTDFLNCFNPKRQLSARSTQNEKFQKSDSYRNEKLNSNSFNNLYSESLFHERKDGNFYKTNLEKAAHYQNEKKDADLFNSLYAENSLLNEGNAKEKMPYRVDDKVADKRGIGFLSFLNHRSQKNKESIKDKKRLTTNIEKPVIYENEKTSFESPFIKRNTADENPFKPNAENTASYKKVKQGTADTKRDLKEGSSIYKQSQKTNFAKPASYKSEKTEFGSVNSLSPSSQFTEKLASYQNGKTETDFFNALYAENKLNLVNAKEKKSTNCNVDKMSQNLLNSWNNKNQPNEESMNDKKSYNTNFEKSSNFKNQFVETVPLNPSNYNSQTSTNKQSSTLNGNQGKCADWTSSTLSKDCGTNYLDSSNSATSNSKLGADNSNSFSNNFQHDFKTDKSGSNNLNSLGSANEFNQGNLKEKTCEKPVEKMGTDFSNSISNNFQHDYKSGSGIEKVGADFSNSISNNNQQKNIDQSSTLSKENGKNYLNSNYFDRPLNKMGDFQTHFKNDKMGTDFVNSLNTENRPYEGNAKEKKSYETNYSGNEKEADLFSFLHTKDKISERSTKDKKSSKTNFEKLYSYANEIMGSVGKTEDKMSGSSNIENPSTDFLSSIGSKRNINKESVKEKQSFETKNEKSETDSFNSLYAENKLSEGKTKEKKSYKMDLNNENPAKRGNTFLNNFNSERHLGDVLNNKETHIDRQPTLLSKETAPNLLKSGANNFENNFRNKKADFGSDLLTPSYYKNHGKYKDWQHTSIDDDTDFDYLNSYDPRNEYYRKDTDSQNNFTSFFDENYENESADTDATDSDSESKNDSDNEIPNPIFNEDKYTHDNEQVSKRYQQSAIEYLKSLNPKSELRTDADGKISFASRMGDKGSGGSEKVVTSFLNYPAYKNHISSDLKLPSNDVNLEKEKDKDSVVEGTDISNSKGLLNQLKGFADKPSQSNTKITENNVFKTTNVDASNYLDSKRTDSVIQSSIKNLKQKKHTNWQHSKVSRDALNDYLNTMDFDSQLSEAPTGSKNAYLSNFDSVKSNLRKQMGEDFFNSLNLKTQTVEKETSPYNVNSESRNCNWQYLTNNGKSDSNTAYSKDQNYRSERKGSDYLTGPISYSYNNGQEKYKNLQHNRLDDESGSDALNANCQLCRANITDEVHYSNIFAHIDDTNSDGLDVNASCKCKLKTDKSNNAIISSNNDKSEQEIHPTSGFNFDNARVQTNKAENAYKVSDSLSFDKKENVDKGLQLGTVVKINYKKTASDHLISQKVENADKKLDVSRSTDASNENNNEVGKEYTKLATFDKPKLLDTKISDTTDHSKDDFSKSTDAKNQLELNAFAMPFQTAMQNDYRNPQQTPTNANFDSQKATNFMKPYINNANENLLTWSEMQAQANMHGRHNSFSDSFRPPNTDFKSTQNERVTDMDAKNEAAAVEKKPHPHYYASEKILNHYRAKNIGYGDFRNPIQLDNQQVGLPKSEANAQIDLKMPRTHRRSDTMSGLTPEYSDIIKTTVNNITRSKFTDLQPNLAANNAHCEFGTY